MMFSNLASAFGLGNHRTRGNVNEVRKPWESAQLRLSEYDSLSMHQLYEGCLLLGGIGAGKTSGPGEAITRFLLASGCGVLWLTAKQDEFERAERLCRQVGRSDDLVRFAVDEPHRFNFLDFELASPGGGVQSAAQLLQDLVDFATRTASGNASDPFWPMAASRLLRMALAICHAAWKPLTVEHLFRFVTSLPTKETLSDPAWREGFCATSIGVAARQYAGDSREFAIASSFILDEWPNWAEKTASSVLAQALNVLDRFMAGGLTHLIASDESTVTPLDLQAGKVIVIDVPYLLYREPGQLVSIVWKLAAIRATLRRKVDANTRPVAILQDEGQLFALPRIDAATQAVGRSSRLISVVMTQNIPLAVSALGGAGMQQEALSWFANFSTKIFTSNSDKESNDYASEMCGRTRHVFFGGSSGPQEPYDLFGDLFGNGPKTTASFNQQLLPDVPPEVFVSQLRRGGPTANFIVDGVVTQSGRRFSNGKPFLVVPFKQDFSS